MVVKNNFFVFAVRNLGVESEKNFPPEDNYPPIKPWKQFDSFFCLWKNTWRFLKKSRILEEPYFSVSSNILAEFLAHATLQPGTAARPGFGPALMRVGSALIRVGEGSAQR